MTDWGDARLTPEVRINVLSENPSYLLHHNILYGAVKFPLADCAKSIKLFRVSSEPSHGFTSIPASMSKEISCFEHVPRFPRQRPQEVRGGLYGASLLGGAQVTRNETLVCPPTLVYLFPGSWYGCALMEAFYLVRRTPIRALKDNRTPSTLP